MILIMDNAHILNILHAHILTHTFGITHTHGERENERFYTHTFSLAHIVHSHSHSHTIYIYICMRIHAHTYTVYETLNMNYEWANERLYVAICINTITMPSAFIECNTRTYIFVYSSYPYLDGKAIQSHTCTNVNV